MTHSEICKAFNAAGVAYTMVGDELCGKLQALGSTELIFTEGVASVKDLTARIEAARKALAKRNRATRGAIRRERAGT